MSLSYEWPTILYIVALVWLGLLALAGILLTYFEDNMLERTALSAIVLGSVGEMYRVLQDTDSDGPYLTMTIGFTLLIASSVLRYRPGHRTQE